MPFSQQRKSSPTAFTLRWIQVFCASDALNGGVGLVA